MHTLLDGFAITHDVKANATRQFILDLVDWDDDFRHTCRQPANGPQAVELGDSETTLNATMYVYKHRHFTDISLGGNENITMCTKCKKYFLKQYD